VLFYGPLNMHRTHIQWDLLPHSAYIRQITSQPKTTFPPFLISSSAPTSIPNSLIYMSHHRPPSPPVPSMTGTVASSMAQFRVTW